MDRTDRFLFLLIAALVAFAFIGGCAPKKHLLVPVSLDLRRQVEIQKAAEQGFLQGAMTGYRAGVMDCLETMGKFKRYDDDGEESPAVRP